MQGYPIVKYKRLFLVLAICTTILACTSPGSEKIPSAMLGVWKTHAPKYAGCYFEIREKKISFVNTNEAGSLVTYKITKIETASYENQTLYTFHYTGPNNQKYEFSVYYYSKKGGFIRFKNQTTIKWIKAEIQSLDTVTPDSG